MSNFIKSQIYAVSRAKTPVSHTPVMHLKFILRQHAQNYAIVRHYAEHL